MNIGPDTLITGAQIRPTALEQALYDRNLNRNVKYSYFGPVVQRGTIEVYVGGEWRTIRFSARHGWAEKVEVV